MKLPEKVLVAFYRDRPASAEQTRALEAAIEQLREEQLSFLDGLTFSCDEPQAYRDGWNDCREDVERFYVLGEEEDRG